MPPAERIRLLCDQLLRAEHPAIIDAVASQLEEAVRDYADRATRDVPTIQDFRSNSVGIRRVA